MPKGPFSCTDTQQIINALAIGYERIVAWADLLDQVNVFPVHDSDTGKNLKISLAPFKQINPDNGAGNGHCKTSSKSSFNRLINKLSMSAIGNSGNISAAFFSGFLSHPLPASLPNAARQGLNMAMNAVADPRPGTMLDLFESQARFFDQWAGDGQGQKASFDTDELTGVLKQSVAQSITRLPALQKAGVVDAGALGMFLFLEGFFKALENRQDQCIPVMESFKDQLCVSTGYTDPSPPAFCVDLQVRMDQSRDTPDALIKTLGDSIVTTQTNRSLKIHVHTRDRDVLKQRVSEIGSITAWDAEPIITRPQKTPARTNPDTVGIITDAAGAITLDRAAELGITLMDSFIVTDDGGCPETLADPARIYADMTRGKRIMTAQASVFQRQETFRKMLGQYDRVLYLCVGSVYTGNYDVAVRWVADNGLSERMHVVDTGAASGRLGLIAETVALAAGTLKDPAELEAHALKIIGACDELLFLNQLKYLAMGGRMSRTGSVAGDMLSIRPIISPRANGAQKLATVRNSDGQIRYAVNRLEREFGKTASPRILLEYSDNRAWVAASVMPQIRQACPRANISLVPLSLTSGVHMGPGTWGMAFLPGELTQGDINEGLCHQNVFQGGSVMKVLLLSMPDVAPLVIHQEAVHFPNLGIASIGGNIHERHEVRIIDLIRKRRSIRVYLTKQLTRLAPDIVGLSAMSWQWDTCCRIIRLIKRVRPSAKIVVGGYHATLMTQEITKSPEGKLIDFIVQGEGETAFKRLVEALDGRDAFQDIPSLTYRDGDEFFTNPMGDLQDLSQLKPPIRDKRRLTWGYHVMNMKAEVLETSRGCTRTCNFCSMKHMYGRTFRTYPIDRVIADLDDIYYNKKTRLAFIVDDNLVLDTNRVIRLCDAIIQRGYRRLKLVVQADSLTMATNEDMIRKMAEAGFKSVFLGIENVSKTNLAAAGKGNIVEYSRKAVALCQKHGLMVIGGLIFGFPDDDETAIIENYQFLKDINADAAYCQILTPYPKTGMREQLMTQGLVTNTLDLKKYNGLWANVKTRHLSADRLQYLFWYHRQTVLGWWDPSARAKGTGKLWTGIWTYMFKPILQQQHARVLKKKGWDGIYKDVLKEQEKMNTFEGL
ncbi:B12-binding domain-containing radical SAM protein [Desulfobacter hydrogenophilus]|uniref:B12-binding domain-containing radical SAM protein n=1 Tax=Desulfobacter hydrogenophilus TaxID=2291 RepID=A0A328FC54_9BACT|nr:DegV family protein [Desulfobacter hydrogenophilus]NDY72599.1 DegV family EDD domain-containing protein [Desulfobacter hydrogenophilus]QBH13320.1 DegV family EDD domain-containing protein [Desulfobacter hydrogenophilus]RAM01280.1 B12-binding domain-containing radical SAM protein [Desulfobacter hydrogenophilus]